jgi:Sigma-70 region 2
MANDQTMHTLPGRSEFPTTRWTLVFAAGDPDRTEARSAVVSLCEDYWYPLYAYLRRRGYPADQAQDLTQEFFVRVLEGRYLDRADPGRGRFRSFLLSSLKFFVADEEDRNRAHKRGGGTRVPLEFSSGEERYQREPGHDETPERIFERPGRFLCSTESLKDCGVSLFSTAVQSISSG